MISNWNEYQEEAAKLFRSLGCTVEIEKRVSGARGAHDIDLWVTFTVFGVETKWIVECKFWKSAVPKEKVLALSQIAQDVGADRAFLVSESGFQAGAIRMATNSNVTLSSLGDLRIYARPDMLRRAMTSLAQKAHNLQSRLYDVLILDDHSPGPWPGAEREVVLDLLSRVFAIETIALPKALADEFPVAMGLDGRRVPNADDFIAEADRELRDVEATLTQLETTVDGGRLEAQKAVASLARAVNDLLAAGGKVSDRSGLEEQAREKARLSALIAMKAVGAAADRTRSLTAGRAATDLQALMRTLIDGVYLDLSQSVIPQRNWDASVRAAESAVRRLTETVGLTKR